MVEDALEYVELTLGQGADAGTDQLVTALEAARECAAVPSVGGRARALGAALAASAGARLRAGVPAGEARRLREALAASGFA